VKKQRLLARRSLAAGARRGSPPSRGENRRPRLAKFAHPRKGLGTGIPYANFEALSARRRRSLGGGASMEWRQEPGSLRRDVGSSTACRPERTGASGTRATSSPRPVNSPVARDAFSTGRSIFPFLLTVFLLPLLPGRASGQSCSRQYLIEQKFPLTGPEETRWRICWQVQLRHGPVITSAHFRKSPSSPWIRVFWDARVGEIFVPYHGNEARFRDVSGFCFPLSPLNATDCPASQGGVLLGATAPPGPGACSAYPSPLPGPGICKQVKDRGLAWKDHNKSRRGQELILWGALDAVNYNYLIEWTFRDDGVVLGRVGATAVNYPGWPLVAHQHSPIWRLDIDLDGHPGDSVHLGTHTEFVPSPPKATDTAPVIGNETGIEWEPSKFHTLHVHDATLKNAKGHPSAFHLMPWRYGTPRHVENFTKNDFWVTKYKASEIFAKDLPSFVADNQQVTNTDVVVWYMGSLHHLTRDEDGEFVLGGWKGEAHVMWTGFILKPHNLFDRTPLFP